ncbi:MAG: hypothetical protein HYY64_08675 [Candidatus Rokubacteria bacterium]|nr:hypothetical protein [Candidatus Rokubacteria bacterium]
MRALGWREAAVAILPLAGALVPSVAAGQPGFYVTPSFSVGEVFDDNLFSTPSRRQKDLISRFTPGIEAGYRSAPLTLLGRYAFDAEVFLDHPELDAPQARQELALQIISRPTRSPSLTLSLDGAFTETETPGQLNVETGLAAGRVRARRLSASPAIAYRFDPLTEGVADYTHTLDEQSEGVDTRTHIGDLRLDRRLTPWDTGSLGYTFRRFTFDLGRFPFDGDETVTSHTFTLGWTHRPTALTTVTLRGGPRVSEGAVDPDVLASIRQRLRLGELSFSYSRSETTVIGRAGTVSVEAFTLSATYDPLPRLRLYAAPAVFRASSDDLEATVYRMDFEATYRIRSWLSLTGAYAFQLQRGGIDAGTSPDQEILRNVMLLRLTIEYPYRVY